MSATEKRSRMRWQLATAQCTSPSATAGVRSAKRAGAVALRNAATSSSGPASSSRSARSWTAQSRAARCDVLAGPGPARELATHVAPALLAHRPARIDRQEGGPHAGLDGILVGQAQASQPAVGQLVEDAAPEQGRDDAARADLGAVQGRLAAGLQRRHLEQVADGVLHARARRRGAGDAHRDAAQRENGGDAFEGATLGARHERRRREQLAALLAGERDDRGQVDIVHAEQRGEIPVGRRGEGGDEIGEARDVELEGRVDQHVGVDDESVGPGRRRGALDAAHEQHRAVVGKAVDAARRLHDGVGQAAAPRRRPCRCR